MSQKLYESDFLDVQLPVFNANNSATNTEASNTDPDNNQETSTQSTESANTEMPQDKNWAAWGDELKKRLANNEDLPKKLPEAEVENAFFEDFFDANWDDVTATNLLKIGHPLRKIIKVLGFKDTNPILGFISQPYVIDKLIKTNLLNINTFKAIYNAIANKLVADAEFFKQNSYNIIYCTQLYSKSAKEIDEYLKLQKTILNKAAPSADDQKRNKKIFLYTKAVAEQDITLRATEINKLSELPTDIADVTTSKLNSYDLAEKISSNSPNQTIPISNKEITTLLDSIKNDPAKMFATLLSLSLSTKSKKAAKALSNALFGDVKPAKLVSATQWLAANNIITKGELSAEDADTIVEKIEALLAERQN